MVGKSLGKVLDFWSGNPVRTLVYHLAIVRTPLRILGLVRGKCASAQCFPLICILINLSLLHVLLFCVLLYIVCGLVYVLSNYIAFGNSDDSCFSTSFLLLSVILLLLS